MNLRVMHRPARLLALLRGGCVWMLVCSTAVNAGVEVAGDVDPRYGVNGQAMFARPDAFALSDAYVGDLATLPDGRTLWVMENGNGGAVLMRLRRDGSADPDFAQAGQLSIADCVRAGPTRIVAEADAAAVIWSGGCLWRITAAGKIDSGFAVQASFPDVTTAFGFRAAELLRDSQGRWLLAGLQQHEWKVYRYLPDGSNDLDFGNAGVASPSIIATSSTRTLDAMVLRSDDSIVLAGSRSAGNQTRLVLFQLDTSGQPDPSFGELGLFEVHPPSGQQGLVGEALAVDSDGSVVIAGRARSTSNSCCVLLLRVDSAGQLVEGSMHLHRLGVDVSLTAFGETASALSILPDRRILLARNSFPPATPLNTRTRFTVLSLLPDGSMDPSFGDQGWRSYVVDEPTGLGLGGAYSQLHGMTYQNGQALLFGRTFFEDGVEVPSYVTLLRVNLDADRLLGDGFEE